MKPRVLALVATLVAVLVLAAALPPLLQDGSARPGPPREAPGPASASNTKARLTVQALAVLGDWDRRRGSAWARGDPERLRSLYVSGSRTGRRDVRMLRAYAARGLRVSGIRMQVLAADLVRAGRGRAVLRVTERLGRAVARDGERAVLLPSDHASSRLVELRRVTGEWLVSEVRDQWSAAATTAATSGSTNS